MKIKQQTDTEITPVPRTFARWCEDLGLECQGQCPQESFLLTYDEFCAVSGVRLMKVREAPLYGFWRKGIDASQSGKHRTVREWLDDIGLEVVDPTKSELDDLNLFLGWDDFMDWSSGIVTDKKDNKNFNILKFIKDKLLSR